MRLSLLLTDMITGNLHIHAHDTRRQHAHNRVDIYARIRLRTILLAHTMHTLSTASCLFLSLLIHPCMMYAACCIDDFCKRRYGTSVVEGRAMGIVLGTSRNTFAWSIMRELPPEPTPDPTLMGIMAIVCCPCFVYQCTCSQRARDVRKAHRLTNTLADEHRMWVKNIACLQSLAKVSVVVADSADVITDDRHPPGVAVQNSIGGARRDDDDAATSAVRGDAAHAVNLGRNIGVATVVLTSRDAGEAAAIASGVFGKDAAGAAAAGVLLGTDLEIMPTVELVDTVKMHVALNGGLMIAVASPKILFRVVQV